MKRITSVIATALLTIMLGVQPLAVWAQAQDTPRVEATIPFKFSAYRQDIASGTYQLNLLSNPFMLSIRNVNTGRKQMLMVLPKESQSPPSHGYLIFRRDGGHSYLAEIHFQGTNLYSELIPEQGPKAAKATVGSPSGSAIVASR